MDVVTKLIRLLQDDYKVGSEMRSGKPIIYVDPNKFDQWRLDRDASRKDKDAVAAQLAEQLDSQYPGISQKFSSEELIFLTQDSLKKGPFSRKIGDSESPICLLNEAKGDQIKVGKIYETFGLTTTFDPSHLKPLTGSNSVWAQMVGEHEGEHCNQAPRYADDADLEVRTLDGEVRSDRAALETLRAEGHLDMIAEWRAIRAIAAANGDTDHATSIFFDDPEFSGVTAEHLEAAKIFRTEMNMGVAANLGISINDARSLRTDDPQKYAISVEDALNKGEIPALRDITENAAQLLVAKRLGIAEENSDDLAKISASEMSAAYQALKAEGALMDRGPQNPYVNKYIQTYIDGTRVLFTKETTPAPKAAPAPIPTKPDDPELNLVPTEEELAERKIKELQQDADIEASTVMDDIIKKTMGITDKQLIELSEKEPDKYYDAAEEGLKNGVIPLQTSQRIPQTQIDDLISKRLGVPVDDIGSQPYFITKKVNEELESEGALTQKRDNSYLKEKIEGMIQQYRQDKVVTEAPVTSGEPVTPATDEAPETEIPTTPTPVAAASTSKYSYLTSLRSDDGKGIPQIDLRSDDKGQMKIGCMTACEYFATKADPVLAVATVDIKDPTLSKVAQNNPSYIVKAGSLEA